MDANSFDPAATLSPDDPLQEWLKDPAMADFVKKKAIEHAQSVLGFSPSADPLGPDSGDTFGQTPSAPTPAAPSVPPTSSSPGLQPVATSVIGKLRSMLSPGEGSPDPTAAQGPVRLDQPPPLTTSPVPVPYPSPKKVVVDTPAAATAPAEADGAALDPEASTDLSSKNKPSKADAIGDFGKTLAGLKPIAPPPLNAVGTPSVRSPGAINTTNVAQILQSMGLQNRPDPISTLGRLLVAGKA